MKIRKVFTALSCAVLLGLGAFGFARGGAKQEVKEADAISLSDDMTFYYIDNWNLGTPHFYEFTNGDVPHESWPGVAMTDTGKTFEYEEGKSAKVFSFVADATTYPKFIINVGSNAKQTQNMQWSWYSAYTGNAFLYTKDNDKDSLLLTDYAAFSILVDSVETPLVRNWGNTSTAEYKIATDKALDPSKPIAVKRNGEAYAVTMKDNIDDNYNNGSIVDGKIVVHNAATTNLYLDANTQKVWVGGFEFDASQNVTVYLLASGFGDMYLYTYDTASSSKAMGTYPGTRMNALFGITYIFGGNSYGVYYVTFPGEATDNRFEFSDGTNAHEATVVRSDMAGADYTYNFNQGGMPGGRIRAFQALARLSELVAEIPANVSEGTVAGSTCGVTKAKAEAIVSEMSTLTSGMAPWLESELAGCKLYLVSAKDGSTHADYTYGEIMTALEAVANGGSGTIQKGILANNNSVLLVIVVSSVTIVALGAFFFLRKRKESK